MFVTRPLLQVCRSCSASQSTSSSFCSCIGCGPTYAGVTHLLIAPSADWSFPSDHATATIAIVAAFAMRRLPRRTIGLLVVAFLICWSRIYIGTHYLTDVIGGAITGALGAVVARLIYRENSRLDNLVTKIL
ncbi:phosphatase PAP2 family protein [Mesorhizobium australicum]|uniref:phosphatase PAP2 family protein n=1 Tax=Mesorhizobium australicum TaxID=536018 RepID=UPI00333675B3